MHKSCTGPWFYVRVAASRFNTEPENSRCVFLRVHGRESNFVRMW